MPAPTLAIFTQQQLFPIQAPPTKHAGNAFLAFFFLSSSFFFLTFHSLQNQPCMPRPAKDKRAAARKSKLYAMDFDCERQFDEDDGSELTPCYAVSENPSIVFSAPGIHPNHCHMPGSENGLLERMDPDAGRLLRRLRYGRLDVGSTIATDDDGHIYTAVRLPPSLPFPCTSCGWNETMAPGQLTDHGRNCSFHFFQRDYVKALAEYKGSLYAGIHAIDAPAVLERSTETIAKLKAEDEELQAGNFWLRKFIAQMEDR